MSFREAGNPESWEEYRARHYRSQYMKAHAMIIDLFLPLEDKFKREMFVRSLTVLLDKMWTPEVYLKEAYENLQKKSGLSPPLRQLVENPPEPKSGGPGDGSAAATLSPESSFPQQPQVSSRKPTQMILPDDLAKLVDIGENRVQAKQYMAKQDWNSLNQILKQYGFKWVSAGKDSRWEKQ